MHTIIDVTARQILDSRGNPTVEVEVELESGAVGRADVPSGASTGEYEAVELRDEEGAFHGKGVSRAVENVNGEIADEVTGLDATDQRLVDRALIELDGTPNKAKLGANAILGVSLATACAAAAAVELPLYQYIGGVNAHVLPVPEMNIMNGGKHADNNVDLQEFMVMPRRRRELRGGSAWLRRGLPQPEGVLKQKGLSTAVGDEGGFAPDLGSNEEAIQAIVQAIEAAGYEPGKDVMVALDPAASSFYDAAKARYVLASEGRELTSAEMVDYYAALVEKYPIVSIEDGLAEGDWEGFKLMTERLGDRIQVMGDDIFVTNTERIARGIDREVRQFGAHQAEPDRHPQRDPRCHRDGQARRLDCRVLAPLRRDRGHHARRPRRRHEHRPDQERRAGADGARGQVQPAASHRGDARGGGRIRGIGGSLQPAAGRQ